MLAVFLVMANNSVPHYANGLVATSFTRKQAIKNARDRDRFLLLAPKIYFNHPKGEKLVEKSKHRRNGKIQGTLKNQTVYA